MLQKLIQKIYTPQLKHLDNDIGCKLVFRHIPDRFINGIVHCNMTKTWKNFGLNIEKGSNYFTFGHVVHGDSSRFDKNSAEYQSWLGAYTLKLVPGASWTPREHFKLAIADQNNWLRWYGDNNPNTNIDGWKLTSLGEIKIDHRTAHLYEFGCNTQSDIGEGSHSLILYFVTIFLAALFNLSNQKLNIKPKELKPKIKRIRYQNLKLKGYIAIVDLKENIKIVFYGNGAIVHHKDSNIDTFKTLKVDLLSAIESCEIEKV